MHGQLTPELKKYVLSKEKGSSLWLSVVPLQEYNFYLHKGEFRNTLGPRYGCKPNNTPQPCHMGPEVAFFDVRVFYSNTSSNCSTDLSSVYRRHEQVKKREYGHGIKEVGHDVFTPLALSTTGGMGREATTFYKRHADMIA